MYILNPRNPDPTSEGLRGGRRRGGERGFKGRGGAREGSGDRAWSEDEPIRDYYIDYKIKIKII